MSRTLAMIHTISGLAPVLQSLAKELMPEVDTFHIADEAVLRMGLAAGGLTPTIFRRVSDDAVFAEAAGADVVLVTCSSISPCVDVARKMVSIPVLKIDEPMVDRAISIGRRIGVAATAPTTLKPTTEQVMDRARLAGKEVAIDAVMCEGAYAALFAGDTDGHDRIIRDFLYQMMEQNDVIILAQVSMARVADQIPESDRRIPILSSPRLGMERVREVIQQLPA
jgi:Asp/Glu/hydantoin racemase